MSENVTPDENSNGTPSPKSGKSSSMSWVIGLLVILAVIGGAFWYQQGQGPSGDLNLQEVENLKPEDQRKELEKQLKDYEDRAAHLSADANISDKYLVYIKLAELQNRLELFDAAIKSVDQIAEQRQDNSRIWATYATSYLGARNIPKAQENIQKALAISDDTPEYWVIYFQAFADAPVADLDAKYVEALRKTNNNIDIVISYARFLEKQGNKEKAIGYWETARNINPDGAAQYEAEIARLRS